MTRASAGGDDATLERAAGERAGAQRQREPEEQRPTTRAAPLKPARGAAELLSQKLTAKGAPVTVTFQVTDRCNYGCVHCYETHGDAEELTLAEIDRILGELAAAGTLFLNLTGGEFFMRRDAEDILVAARRHRFAIKLLTTGWFVDERRADLIARLGSIQVDMSFYAGDPTRHDHVTQIKGSWQRTVDAARRLRARRVPVVLKAPIMVGNLAGLEGMREAARELDCAYQIDPKVTGREDGGDGPTGLRVDDDELRRFYGDVTGIWQEVQKVYGGCSTGPSLDDTPCRAGVDVCGINPQGMVSACHTLPIWAGDLRQRSFADIWQHSAHLKHIRELTWRRIEECNTCDLRPMCSRCHGMAYLEDGKLAGPSLEACRHAVVLRDLLRDRGVRPADESLPPPLAEARRRLRPAALRVIA